MSITAHTSRTIMFKELSNVMYQGLASGSLTSSLAENAAGKLSRSNQEKTNRYLRQLYGLDESSAFLKAFEWFWKQVPEGELPVITFLYAIQRDYLLAQSIEVVSASRVGERVSVNSFEDCIERHNPNRFSEKTRLSVAQNLASSWKQAGFIEGKVKNIRRQPELSYWPVVFGLVLGYLEGLRGEYLLGSKYLIALGIPMQRIREYIVEASRRDLLQYQYSGNVTTIILTGLLNKIGI